MLSSAPFDDSAALSAFIRLRHVFALSHNSSYVVSDWFRTVNKVLVGSIWLQAHNPRSLSHSCRFRLRAYQPRQAQKPTMETAVTTTRAKVFPASLASAGRIRKRRMSHMMAAAFGSSSLGAMLMQVSRSQLSESDDAKAAKLPGPLSQSQFCFIPASPSGCFAFHIM